MSFPTRLARLTLSLLCLGALPASAADVVRLGNLKFAQYGAVSYMKEIAPKYGLKIEETFFDKGIDIITQIKEGKLDVGASAADGAIAGWANGVPIYVVAGFARGGARLVGRADVPIPSVKGLKGKRVGVLRGAAPELLLYAELVQHGLTWAEKPGQDVVLVYTGNPAELNKALETHAIDAMCQSEPYATQAISRGFGREILKPYDTPLGEPVRALVMTKALYDGKPEVALRFLRCFVDATRHFIANHDDAEKYIRTSMFGGRLTAADYDSAISNAPFTTDITVDQVQTTAYYMVKYGAGKLPVHPVAAEFVRLDLLERAKRAAAR